MIGLASIALTVALGIAYNLFQQEVRDQRASTMREFGTSIQQEIVLASEVHPGYERNVTLPDKVDGRSYSVSIQNNALFLSHDDGDIYYPLPKTTGSISTGTVTIRNEGGTVHVS